ncbi:polymerase [Vesiculovirus jurona]|uniref:RNA-directed RNA polymerase L n=2 Tax=Vesiculovirus jurona TaxID=1972568 RepID=I1SV85_9RHAB|nr:polymerase [Vesiculovirus jurona]AEG25349.1 polymerase [Vesiculovirus jurona]AJR28383.1 polymerase [Vesiculovirus jurona]
MDLESEQWGDPLSEENFISGQVPKEDRVRNLNSVDYNLNSPLISDDIKYLISRYHGKAVPGIWKKKNWNQTLDDLQKLQFSPIQVERMHHWYGEWLLSNPINIEQGKAFLADVDKESEITYCVVESFLKGWTGTSCHFKIKDGPHMDYVSALCQKFLDLHKLTLLMNASTHTEESSLANTFKIKKYSEDRTVKLPTLGKVKISGQFLLLITQSIILDRNFLLMMKDVIIGRMQTILSMINRSDERFSSTDITDLRALYATGDNILRELGNQGFDLIKTIEPICNLKLSEMAREYRPLIPDFPHFREHVVTTVKELSGLNTRVQTLFDNIMGLKNLEVVLVVYSSFRHWGHPFIDYIEGLKKLHHQVTLEKDIDEDYAKALASDLARIVLTKEFNEKKRWSVDYDKLPANHVFKEHVRDNTWPTPALIQDFGDKWHELPLVQCFDIPDLIDPSIIYSDKSHSMNKREVMNHIKSKSDQPIPSKKVLKTMIEEPATNWLEFLEMIDKHGLDDDDLIIGLKGKERELKIAGRFFSLMSWKLREYFVITEYLIKTHFVPLFYGLTMADDMTSVIKKMLESSSGQGLNDYSAISIANHIDYEKWNNHQRRTSNEPVFKVMGQFLGYPNLISRTHEFFEKSLIYYNGRPDLMRVRNGVVENSSDTRVCWNGQAGGLEGLRQKGWSILNLLVIQRESKIRNTSVKVLAQGDNQVICTQYKTKQHRSEIELRGALEQMKSNNQTIMDSIERGTNRLGLLINQDETMQSADYLNYGKVPIFRGVIRGLETKRWSRVTCVTNDQLPTCANLLSSVSTNALTVSHFSVNPINAMIQYNYFSNFSRLLLYMHDPALRCSLYEAKYRHLQIDSLGFKLAMAYLDPSIGGVCGTALTRFLIRSFPDPVTESLSFWKLIHDNTTNQTLKNLSIQFGNPKIAQFRPSHIDKLLEDPTSLNIAMGMSPTNLLKTEIKKNLLRTRGSIKNKIVKDAVSYIHSEDENLRSFLWSINPLFPRFLSEFKSGTFMGVASSVVSLFQNSRTIRNTFKNFLSNQIDDLIIRSEQTSLEHLASYVGKHSIKIWVCSASHSDSLRRKSWGRQVLGTTIPHPLEMHGRGHLKNASSICCQHRTLDYISVHCPKGLNNVLDSRGDLAAYLGSKTSESTSILQPWEKESKIPLIKRATRLRDAIHWFVEADSNLAKSITNNIVSLTGEDWGSSVKGFKRTGSALHRFSTSRMSHGGFAAQSPACLTRMLSTTDTMRDYATDNFDFMFQASLIYSQASASVMLYGTSVPNTIHFHTACKGCIRKIEEPWLESPRIYNSKNVSNVLGGWRNGQGAWGSSIQQLKPVPGNWDTLSPSEKSYHVGRALGFLYGDLIGQSSSRSEDSSIFPLSIQYKLRGRGFMRGILDGLVRASACQVIHRRSIALLVKPANAIYGGLIFLIDRLSNSSSFINLCRDGPIREELRSIPHKIPTSYPTSLMDMGINVRNYLKYQCKSVELGKYKSDIETLWIFSDLMSVTFSGPFALSSKILKHLYKPTLSKKDRTNLRKLSNFSQMLRSKECWDGLEQEYLSSKLSVCEEEVRHACKFGIKAVALEIPTHQWGEEESGWVNTLKVELLPYEVPKNLLNCPRKQNPTISGIRLGQLPTGAHYKIRSILKEKQIKYRDFLCGGDGSGGMTAACLRYNPRSRGIFNSILEFDGSSMKGSSPDPPSALETVYNGMKRCVNALDCWEYPSDLSLKDTWKYFKILIQEHSLKIDLIVLDMEVRELDVTEKIENQIRNNIYDILSTNGTLIYKTYGSVISSERSNSLTRLGPLFEDVELLQTEYSSSSTSELYFVGRKLKNFVDMKWIDWASLEYGWDKIFCFRDSLDEFKRARSLLFKEHLKGIPRSFLPDPLVNLETLMQISGIPSGIAHQLCLDFKAHSVSGITASLLIMSLSAQFAIDTTRRVSALIPPSDGRLHKMACCIVGVSLWTSIKYNDILLNKTCVESINRSFPIRLSWDQGFNQWNTYGPGLPKDIRISDGSAILGNWIRGMELMNLSGDDFDGREFDRISRKYIRTLSYQHVKRSTGLKNWIRGKVSKEDMSLMRLSSGEIPAEHWVE